MRSKKVLWLGLLAPFLPSALVAGEFDEGVVKTMIYKANGKISRTVIGEHPVEETRRRMLGDSECDSTYYQNHFKVIYDTDSAVAAGVDESELELAIAASDESFCIWADVLEPFLYPTIVYISFADLGNVTLGSTATRFHHGEDGSDDYEYARAQMRYGNIRSDFSHEKFPDVDIASTFNVAFKWYYGLDIYGIADDEMDYISTFVHEIGHGLGFVDLFYPYTSPTQPNWSSNPSAATLYSYLSASSTANNATSYSASSSSSSSSSSPTLRWVNPDHDKVMDQSLFSAQYIVGGANGVPLTGDAYPSGKKLTKVMTGQYGEVCIDDLAGTCAVIYTPSVYEPGSTGGHLDEDTYPAANLDSLMTPLGDFAEVNRCVGPITRNIFQNVLLYDISSDYNRKCVNLAGITHSPSSSPSASPSFAPSVAPSAAPSPFLISPF